MYTIVDNLKSILPFIWLFARLLLSKTHSRLAIRPFAVFQQRLNIPPSSLEWLVVPDGVKSHAANAIGR
jgi:hypothetical protein